MQILKMYLPGFLVFLGLVCFVNTQLSCPPFNIDDLGNTTELSTEGLLARSLVTVGDGAGTVVQVRINNYRILCDASGSTRNTSSSVSVLVEFQCSFASGTGEIANCDGTTNLTRQYQYSCSVDNQWVLASFPQTLNPSATFQTEPNNQCRSCFDPSIVPTVDPDTHCLSCDSTLCNQGLGRCFVRDRAEECCNFYLEDECVTLCPDALALNSTSFGCGCVSLNLSSNGSVSYSNGLAIGSIATHTCDSGYRVSDAGVRNCTTNGWTGQDITCELISGLCPGLNITNGGVDIVPSDRSVNSKATYSCSGAYNLNGTRERFCQVNGTWSGSDPDCELLTCPDLNPVANGEVSIVPPNRSVNSKATYSCSGDYNLKGNRERLCQVDGTWSGTVPECEKKSGISPGAIAGIVIAVVIAVLLLIALTVGIIVVVSYKTSKTPKKVEQEFETSGKKIESDSK